MVNIEVLLTFAMQAVLFVAFGSMQSDLRIWRRTDAINGYIQAV